MKNAPKCQVRLGRGGQYGYCPPKMGHFCNDLEIGFGPPTADFGSVWSSEKVRKI